MTEIKTRELHVRAAVNAETREISGVGVPYGETITVWGQRERLNAGSVEAEGAKLFYRHSEPIGIVTAAKDDESGWHPTAKISATARGDEAYQLARDGVLDGLSIGFDPIEYHIERDDLGDVIVYDRVAVREVSLVPFPAYPSARVESVRERPNNPRREDNPNMPENETQERGDDLREIREQVQDLGRQVALAGQYRAAEPVTDERSAGAWLRDLVRGDADTIREYEGMVERAFAGGTSADGILTPQYVGDTIRLIEAPNVLGSIFSTGVLPAKGLKLEYGVLESDDVDVDEQVNEGDDLTTGKITLDVEHADIKTYGGAVELSRQKIERTTNVNVLDLHLRALALRAGRRKAAVLRAHYAALVATNAADPDRVAVVEDATDWIDWLSAIIDGAEWFADLGLPLDALVAGKDRFKELASLKDSANRPLMVVSGTGDNTVGRINAKTLGGDLAGVTVRLDLKGAADRAAFVNGEAIRQYNSPLVELADENIINLSKQFGVYYYGALATEIPGAVVPVVPALPAGVKDGK
ncbi:major capsid and protease fusion protein [Microbacterium phage Sippinontea]|uniref:Major capsid and protease fusion protein n=1 Tax=Microbacterium phage Quaker TaxID=2250352 RepID=A0A2Z5H8D3_9CAUD|nr:major head protein [Microbacterium phage Quaker]AXC35363.1 major capsid and protease fusion protein [Microbacterium phage KayPaulus]QKY78771.1 major capsid and protease fusion protein [Microbacterium phage Livingwater]QOI67281.1 major capsid and protease fusion protein [Microbacterium phage Sippinontea]QRI45125.1 major capsid and protease fusion protein [Microbacterium phage Wolfpack]UVK59377.1 major capsid and protease fusion protein [Microbacterium phage MrGreen]UYL85382.1 major capsid a